GWHLGWRAASRVLAWRFSWRIPWRLRHRPLQSCTNRELPLGRAIVATADGRMRRVRLLDQLRAQTLDGRAIEPGSCWLRKLANRNPQHCDFPLPIEYPRC